MTLEERRDLTRAFWREEPTSCPDHPGSAMKGTFVRTTYYDHLVFECEKGRETVTIAQRPRQTEYNEPQVEGLILNIERGDSILCYRCQSKIATLDDAGPARPASRLEFTCVRCLSWGIWESKAQTSAAS